MAEHPVGKAAKQGPADAAAAQTCGRRIKRHRRQTLVRRRTVAAGTGLGVLLLAGLTLAGSLGSRTTPPAPAPAKPIEPGTLSASQPQLEQAVLRAADLPGNYKPAQPKATVRRLPDPEKCSALLDPNALIRTTKVAETTGQASSLLQGPTQLSQLLTTFAGDGATATMQELQRVTQQCRDFQSVLDDGTPVRVQVEAKPIDPDTYSMRLTLTGGGRTETGYLTLRRAGQVLSVLRQLGNDTTVDPLKLVDQTLTRLTTQR